MHYAEIRHVIVERNLAVLEEDYYYLAILNKLLKGLKPELESNSKTRDDIRNLMISDPLQLDVDWSYRPSCFPEVRGTWLLSIIIRLRYPGQDAQWLHQRIIERVRTEDHLFLDAVATEEEEDVKRCLVRAVEPLLGLEALSLTIRPWMEWHKVVRDLLALEIFCNLQPKALFWQYDHGELFSKEVAVDVLRPSKLTPFRPTPGYSMWYHVPFTNVSKSP